MYFFIFYAHKRNNGFSTRIFKFLTTVKTTNNFEILKTYIQITIDKKAYEPFG